MKSNSIHFFQKSVVFILLFNLFLSIVGVSAQNSQVDCSKLAFSPDDLPTELRQYAMDQDFSGTKNFQKFSVKEIIEQQQRGKMPALVKPAKLALSIAIQYVSIPENKPKVISQCDHISDYHRQVPIEIIKDEDRWTRPADQPAEVMGAGILIFNTKVDASSVYIDLVHGFEELMVTEGWKADPLNEKFGEESTSWISKDPSGIGNLQTAILISVYRIQSAVAFCNLGWHEGDYPTSFTDDVTGETYYILESYGPCEDAGLIALRNWSGRLLRELSGDHTTPPVTTGRCSIEIEEDRKKLAVDDISQLTFTGTVTGEKSVTESATSVDLKITVEVSKLPSGTSTIKLNLKEERDIRVQRTNPPSFKFVYRPKSKTFIHFDLTPGLAILEASVKDSSGNVLAKGSKEFTLIRPPVLLIHGIWSYSQELEPIKNYLESHGFQYVFSYNYGNNPPADWHDNANGDIDQIAQDLRSFEYNDLETRLGIDNVNWSRFDIVAHSAGGLIARKYIENEPEKVRKLVTIATPHYGSDAANILAYWMRNSGHIDYDPSWAPTGHRTDVSYDERVELLINDTRKLAKTELLIGGYGVMVEQLTIPGDVVINKKASDYIQVPEEGRTRLTEADVGEMPWTYSVAGEFIKNLNSPEYDHFLDHISLLCIAANRSDFGFFTVPNDGIVTVTSAISLAARMNRPYQVIQNTDHTNVKNLKDTQFRVACFLTDRDHTAFSVYSPVRIHVYDKDGNDTGLRKDGTIETQIPNSEYFEENNASHVIVYGSGEYRAVCEAYANGNATFSITRQVADEGLKIISYNDVLVNKAASYTVIANPSLETPMLEVDLNGDGTTDEEIKPSDYQYYPPEQETDNNDEDDGERPDGFRNGAITIVGAGLIVIFIVALLIYRNRTTTTYVPAYAKDKQLRQPIQQIPTTLVCPSCGSQNPSNAKYCIKCSKPIKQSNYCEECGKEIPSGSTYCPVCGDKQGVA